MNLSLISTVVKGLLEALPEDAIKKGLDALLDVIENKVEKSDTQWDDITIGALCKVLRKQLGIEESEGSEYADK